MPPKQKGPAKRNAWKRFEDGFRRLFRSREHTPSVPEPKYTHLNFTNWDGLERFNDVLKSSGGAIQELTSAIHRFSGCIKAFEASEQARANEEYKKIGTDLNDLFHALAEHFEGADTTSTTLDSYPNLAQKIDEETMLLEAEQPGELSDDVGTVLSVDEVLRCYCRIRTSLALFVMNESTKMWKVDDDEVLNTRLEQLLHSPNAHYRATDSKDVYRSGCMPNTRTNVLQDLLQWVHYGKFQKVYWLSGTAGTGKTTVAYSLCEWLENSGRPSASFFCSRDMQDCRDVKRIIPSLAYQLAQLSRPFRCAVSNALEGDPEACSRPVDVQFQNLIVLPFQNVGHTFGVDVVMVLDGLEKCEDKHVVNRLLDASFDCSSSLPVRFLITSSPNLGISNRMRASQRGDRRAELRLDEIDRTVIQQDVRTYLRASLDGSSLPDEDLEGLAKRSGVSFRYVASVVRYLNMDNPPECAERLKRLPDASSASKDVENQNIDMMCTAMFEEALDHSRSDESGKAEMMLVLRTAACARDCLTVSTVTELLQLDFSRLMDTRLHVLLPELQISGANGLSITLSRPFSKYLADPQRSHRFHRDGKRDNGLLARSCLELINATSAAFNICNLDSSYLLDGEVADIEERKNEAISEGLWYASQHWGAHLSLAESSDELLTALESFLSRRLLLWMEVMNIKGSMAEAAELLQVVQAWLKKVVCPATIRDQVLDAQEFVAAFSSGVASKSTPHIYISALPFWPAHRPVSVHFRAMLRCGVKARGTRLDKCGPLHAETKEPVDEPLEGHTARVSSVAYSPNGAYIVSGSCDQTIRIWDAQTGRPVGQPLKGHTDWVRSVAYSPDGAYIASGSSDKTIRIWDAQTGQPVGQPLKGHTSLVWSVAYLPDGAYIASGSADRTIRIWDAQTGQPVGQPLRGHTDWVWSVVYSPDGAYIASGSEDNTVCIWDVQTGQPVGQPLKGHTDAVVSVAYSPDGAYIVSGSADMTVQIWDAQSSQPVGQPLKGHTSSVVSVAYSPDGAYIASGSWDDTVRIWDAHTGQPVAQPLKSHTSSVLSVAYSPDGVYIASGSIDCTICIWDSLAGHVAHSIQPLSLPLRSHAQPSNRSFFRSALTWYIPRTLRKPTLAAKNSAMLTSEESLRFCVLDDQGWVVNARQERLIWVPEDFQALVLVPPVLNRLPLGDHVLLNFCDAKLGTEWRDCFDSSKLYV